MVVTHEESGEEGEEGELRCGRGRMQRRRLRGQIMAWSLGLPLRLPPFLWMPLQLLDPSPINRFDNQLIV